MHIVVVGAGEVGAHIVETLVAEGQDVALIERDPEKAAAARERLDALVLDGNGASPALLREASIERARLLVAVTDSDDSNLIACMAGRSMGRPELRTVARVRDLTYFGRGSSMAHGQLGIDLVISPDRTTANDIANALKLPGAITVEQFAEGRIVVGEVVAERGSPAVGRTFGDLRREGQHVVAGFTRSGELSIAYDEVQVEEGDHLFVVSSQDDAARTVAFLAGTQPRVKRVMILGATKIGMHLANLMQQEGCIVSLLEADRARAEYAAHRLQEVLVLRAAGTDRATLIEEGIADVDAFVACATDDAANLLTALTARQLGASHAYSIVSRSDYLPLVDAMQVDAAYSPRIHTADAILRYVRRGGVERVHHFASGAEMLEFLPREQCPALAAPLRELSMPRDCIVSAIVRGNEVIYPRGDAHVQQGDRVVVLVQRSALAAVERMFGA